MDLALNGQPSNAGIDVSGDTAMNFSAVFCAVNIIAGSIASLPLQLYQRIGKDAKKALRDTALFDLLHNSPNREMTSYVFREVLQTHLLLWGNAYAEIIPDRTGSPSELWPVNPAAIKVIRGDDNRIRYEIREQAGKTRIIPAERMFHIPGLGFDGRLGYSVIAKARESLALGLAMEEFQARFYGQGTNVGAVLEHPGHLSDEAHKRLVEDLQEKRAGLEQAHKTMVLEEGMKFVKTSMPLEDAQFLESRVFQISEIARWFNIPPHKLKELSKATYSNIEQQQIEFGIDTIRPWAVRWEQHILWKLLRPDQRRTQFAEFNLDGILRGDTKSRMEAYAIMRNVGAINADEIREKENMNPIGGRAGQLYWKPLNMGDAASEDVEKVPTDPPADAQKEDNSLMRVVQ